MVNFKATPPNFCPKSGTAKTVAAHTTSEAIPPEESNLRLGSKVKLELLGEIMRGGSGQVMRNDESCWNDPRPLARESIFSSAGKELVQLAELAATPVSE